MNSADVAQALAWIKADIGREIQLADASHVRRKRKLIERVGVTPGGGNFLAALGLMCYTEFAGRIRLRRFGDGNSRSCFDSFFGSLGPAYSDLLIRRKIYRDLRCGLAHAYFVRGTCEVAIHAPASQPGVIWTGKRYVIAVSNYLRDFVRSFEAMLKEGTGAQGDGQFKSRPNKKRTRR